MARDVYKDRMKLAYYISKYYKYRGKNSRRNYTFFRNVGKYPTYDPQVLVDKILKLWDILR